MYLFKTIIYIFYLIITLSIIKIFPSNANNYIETFNIPNDFQENALVLDYNDSIILGMGRWHKLDNIGALFCLVLIVG